MLLRRGRMRYFCNTTCKISLTVWKMNSKNPQLEKKRFAKTLFPSDFSFKTARMQFWHTCQKVYNEALNFFAYHQQFLWKSIKKLVWVKLRIMMTHSFQLRQLFLKLFTKRPKIFRSLSDVDRKEVKSQKIVSATGSSWIVDFYFEYIVGNLSDKRAKLFHFLAKVIKKISLLQKKCFSKKKKRSSGTQNEVLRNLPWLFYRKIDIFCAMSKEDI